MSRALSARCGRFSAERVEPALRAGFPTQPARSAGSTLLRPSDLDGGLRQVDLQEAAGGFPVGDDLEVERAVECGLEDEREGRGLRLSEDRGPPTHGLALGLEEIEQH